MAGLFHVLAAIVWVGGATITQVMALRIIRSGDDRQVAGIAQTKTGRPETGRLGTFLEESSAGDPECKRRLARILNVSKGKLLLLVGVVFPMVIKVGA